MSRPAPSYVSGPSSEPLLGQTLWQALESAAERWPGADALVSRHQSQR